MWYAIVNSEYSGQPATRYLTGFAGSTSVLLFNVDDSKTMMSTGKSFLLLDGRYWEQESFLKKSEKRLKNLQIVRVHREFTTKQAIEKIIKENRIFVITIDPTITSYFSYEKLSTYGVKMETDTGIFEKIRAVKTEKEIGVIKKAIEIAETSFEVIRPHIQAGAKESDIAARLEYEMKMRGAEKIAFETIVASGVRAAAPHAQTTTKIIEPADSVIIDFGCFFEGYASDLTRTILMPEASGELVKINKIVGQAHSVAVKALKPGVVASFVDHTARSIIEAEGYGDKFLHSTGHGVGMSVHESPHIGALSEEILQSGNVITIEPGIYLPNVGGVRIETTEIIR